MVDEPCLSGPYDVVVKIAAAGLCRTDIHIIERMLEPFGVRLPYTPGHETGRWVELAGPEVHAVRPGDAVLVNPNELRPMPPLRRARAQDRPVDRSCSG